MLYLTRAPRRIPALRFLNAGLLLLLSACVIAEGERPSVTFGADAAVKYLHRGMVQNERGVVQPELIAAIPAKRDGTVIMRAWGNLDLSDDTGDAWLPDGHGGRFSQIDFNLLYEQLLGDYVVTMGVVSYNLPNGIEFPFGERGSTLELMAEASTILPESFFSLQPTVSVNADVDEADGVYIRASLARAFDINEKWNAEAELGLAWMDENQASWNYAQSPPSSGLADLTLHGRVNYLVDRHTTTHVTLAWSQVVDDGYRDWLESIEIEDSHVWLATGVRWSY